MGRRFSSSQYSAALAVLLTHLALGVAKAVEQVIDKQVLVKELPAPNGLAAPRTEPRGMPGEDFPKLSGRADEEATAPVIAAWTTSAKPDESVFLAGSNLRTESRMMLLGPESMHSNYLVPTKAQWMAGGYGLAIVRAELPDAMYLGWVGSENHWSMPFRLNAPELWWLYPDELEPGDRLRLFGRNLARRPNSMRAFVYLEPEARNEGLWLEVPEVDTHTLTVKLSEDLAAGMYRVWVHAGTGGAYGWSDPVPILVVSTQRREKRLTARNTNELRQAFAELGSTGGGVIKLEPGIYQFTEPLAIPGGITIEGKGLTQTILQFRGDIKETLGLVKQGAMFEDTLNLSEPVASSDGLGARAAVLIFQPDVALRDLSILGNASVDQGIAIAGTVLSPVRRVKLERIRVGDLGPFRVRAQHGQTAGILARHAKYLELQDSEVRGNGAALYLEDVTQGAVTNNVLSGRGEGVIMGREGGVREVIVEANNMQSSAAGAPSVVRMMWLSTLFGSTYHNYVAHNRGARFGGVPGSDQNVGEGILFETALTHPYVGSPETEEGNSVTLPSEADWELLSDATGYRRTRLTDYFVVILSGRGQGQVRRITGRAGRTLTLEQPWRVAPSPRSVILITELFYRNLVIGNEVTDAMTGIQFWTNAVENVVANNRLRDMRREGILLYGNAVSGPQTSPPHWPVVYHNRAGFNRGIGPVFFNDVEGNAIRNSADGISVSTGDFRAQSGPIDWPLSLGNTVRHNTVEKARFRGIRIATRGVSGNPGAVPGVSLAGNIVEFNLVRDVPIAYDADFRTAGTVFRRNLAYFWQKQEGQQAAIRIESDGTRKQTDTVIEDNVFEDAWGNQGEDVPGVLLH